MCELKDGDYYVCSGLKSFPYDVAEWGGDRIGVEFKDPAEARRLAELLNSGKAVVSRKTLSTTVGRSVSTRGRLEIRSPKETPNNAEVTT